MANKHSAPSDLLPNFHYPSPVYYQSMFVLRLMITADKQPLSIKGPDTRPVFCIGDDSSRSVEVSQVIHRASRVLNKAEIDCAKVFFDEHSPFLAITFSTRDTHQHMSSFFRDSEVISSTMRVEMEPLLVTGLQVTPPQLDMEMELYLCSPSRDTTSSSKLYRIDSSSNVRFYIDLMEESKMFNFERLMDNVVIGADQNHPLVSDSVTVPEESTVFALATNTLKKSVIEESQHVCKWNDLYCELLKAADHWFSLGVILEVPNFRLMSWRSQWDNSPAECLRDMLYWLDRNRRPPTTWEQVITALCTVGRHELSYEICLKYGVPSELIQAPNAEEGVSNQEAVGNQISVIYEYIDKVDSLCSETSPALLKELKDLEHQTVELRRQLESTQASEEGSSTKVVIDDLQKKLVSSEQDYLQARKRLRSLMEELAQRTSELQEKSSSLQELEERDMKQESVYQARIRWQLDQQEMELVRSRSQESYLQEIEDQIELEETKISDLNERSRRIRKRLPIKESRIAELSDQVANNTQRRGSSSAQLDTSCPRASAGLDHSISFDETGEQEQMVELQIEITKDNIKLVKLRLECAQDKIKLESIKHEIEQRQESLKSKKKYLPDLSKCQVEGLDLLKKAKLGSNLELKVHLLNNEGKSCHGHHNVTLHDMTSPLSEPYVGKLDDAASGTYTLAYYPRTSGKHSLNMLVNGRHLPVNPVTVIVTSEPHLPNCSYTINGYYSFENCVGAISVKLADKCGDAVMHCNMSREITLTLSHRGQNALLTTPQVVYKGGGVYFVTYMSGTADTLDLTVSVNGKPLPGPNQCTIQHSSGTPPLHGAVLGGHLGFAKQLLDKKANPNQENIDRETALHSAARRGHVEIVHLLVSKGARVECANRKSATPLMLAAEGGHTSAVQALLQHKAKVNGRDKNSVTPLMFAAGRGHISTVDTLLKHKAKVNAKDKTGETPLHKAATVGHSETVELLLRNGAEVDSYDKDGKTPLQKAAERGHSETAKLLLQNGAKVDSCGVDLMQWLIDQMTAMNILRQ